MQLTTFLSTASAIIATASARDAVTLNQECDLSQPRARIINRCDYDIHLWSVFKGDGCPDNQMVTLKTGETYAENYQNFTNTKVGVSIKISKSSECKGSDITQLEYYRAWDDENEDFRFNYLDVSYVDCGGLDCPARKDGYYLVAGDQVGEVKASAANTWCPILSCSDAESCDKMSYVLPDDVQTKTCQLNANMDFYMCGSEAPTEDYGSTPKTKPEPSKKPAESSAAPSSTSKGDGYGAVVTPSPTPTPSPSGPGLIKTEFVYVTAYVNAKRHEHGRRHQVFHA